MKVNLISLLIKNCCTGKQCKECGFLSDDGHCYLTDILISIRII